MPDVYSPNSVSNSDAMKVRILPLRQRAELQNKWLMERLENVLPNLLKEEGIDMWLVIAREYNEDPVILSMLPKPVMHVGRRTLLLFYLKKDGSIERLNVHRFGQGEYYKGVWDPKQEDQHTCLTRLITERDPKKIGVNYSQEWAFGDGITYSEYNQIVKNLPQKYIDRIVSAERLCVRWLETRTQTELNAYRGIMDIGHAIISEAFSPHVIHPGVTTTDDVAWWIHQKIVDLGLVAWFKPTIDLQAKPEAEPVSSEKETDSLKASPATLLSGRPMQRNVIQQGDLLHCDVGLEYLGLCTDVQRNAYVLKPGETDAPKGLKNALKDGNRLQDIHSEEMITGKSGNEILRNILERAKGEGLIPSVYTHPIGTHGHGAGPLVGLWDRQEGVPGRGDFELNENTCYSIELNIRKKVPEWGDAEVRMLLEEDAAFTGGKLEWISGRQTRFYLI